MAEAENLRVAGQAERMARVLADLALTGNMSQTCRNCTVPRSTVDGWRRDPNYIEKWRGALARYETRRLQALAGEVVKPCKMNGTTQQQFLDTLAATASAPNAATAVGIALGTILALRRRDAAFAAAWDAAIAVGYSRLEAQMLDECVNGVEPEPDGGRKRVSDATRSKVVANGARKAGARAAATQDEAERDRNEALAARWIARMLRMIRTGQ